MTVRRRLSPEQRRDELLDAATELVLEQGVDGLGLEAVAERAGCSRNLAYTYFANRDALVDALAERERHRFAVSVLDRIPRPSTFDEWARAWISLVLDIAEARGRLLAVLFDERASDAVARRRAGDPMVVAAATTIGESLGLDEVAATALAYVVRGAVVGGAVAVAVGGVDRAVVEEQLRAMLAAVPGSR